MRRLALVMLLLAVACGNPAAVRPRAERVVATPAPTSHAEVSVDLPVPETATSRSPTTPPRTRIVVEPTPAPRTAGPVAAAPAAAGLSAFTGLGSWIDVFDYDDGEHPLVPLVRSMAKRGVRTLYLETGRFTAPTDIQFPKSLGAGLDEAKAQGMRVVAWYPPAFDDVKRDVRRSVAAVNFRSPEGNRFDAFGADIEYTERVPDHDERNARAIEYSRKLRAAVGASYPMGAIVIPPTSLERNAQRWPDFPWSELAKSYQLFMPMNYWTAYEQSAASATDLTRRNVEETRKLTGKPVHIIGGLGEDADRSQVGAYVRAAIGSGSIGGSLYDFTTTRSDVWAELVKLNR